MARNTIAQFIAMGSAIPGDRGSAVFRRSIINALGVADSGKL